MIDALAMIRDFLAANVDLGDLVGERIYAGRDVPPVGYVPGDGGCIVFKVRGGLPDYEDALLFPSVQFKCYSTSEYEANRIYRALCDALHNGRGADVLHGEIEVVGQTMEEASTEWVFVLAFFKVMLRQA